MGGFASLIPPATATYLAYSSVRNPIKTLRAAKNLVVGLFKKKTPEKPPEKPPTTNSLGRREEVYLLESALTAHGYSDWYRAILLQVKVLLGEKSPLSEVIRIADEVYRENPVEPIQEDLVGNTDWKGKFNSDKIKLFQAWLKTQIQSRIRGVSQEELWKQFALEGLKKGAGRSFDQVMKNRPEMKKEKLDFYRGTKEQFLRSSFAQPIATDKLKILASRSFDELDNVTTDMETSLSRILTDGLAQGKSPLELSGELEDQVGFSSDRARTVARTEIIRAHAEGQLMALRNLGIEQEGSWCIVVRHQSS
jgi:hypothetical protein